MYLLEQKLLHALTAERLWDGRAPTVVRRGVHAEVAVPMSWIAEQDGGLAAQLLSVGSLSDSGFWQEVTGALVCDRVYPALLDAWLELGRDHTVRAGYRAQSSPECDILFTPTAVRVGVHLRTVERMLLRQLGLPPAGNDCMETTLALGVAVRDSAQYGLRLLDRDVLVCALLRACEWDGAAKDKAGALHTLLTGKLGSDGQAGGKDDRLAPLPIAEVRVSAALMSDVLVDCFVLDQGPDELLRSMAPGCLPLLEFLQAQTVESAPAATGSRQQSTARKSHLRNQAADLDSMAVVTPTLAGLDALVLPPSTLEGIQSLVTAIQNRSTVLTYWSFAQRVEFGAGIIACFHGDSGVGKTFAARAVANDVGKALRVVRAAEVQSSLVGVAEKNIDALFGQVDTENTILVIDEADTLFSSRRFGGTTSQDFYINSQVNGLLAAVERFDGVLILTTNCLAAFDEAFGRRIAFKVHFTRPDAEARERLWRRLLAAPTPLAADIDFRALAHEHALTGGEIKNAVVKSAFVAAAAKAPISMAILRREASSVVGSPARKTIGFAAPGRLVDLSVARAGEAATRDDAIGVGAAPVAPANVTMLTETPIGSAVR